LPTLSQSAAEKVEIESKTDSSTIPKNIERETMAILCHELRNPLNGMLGNAQLMRAGLDGLLAGIEEHRENPDMQCDVSVLYRELQKCKKRLKSIESCGKDQLTILNHFLDLSKLEQAGAALESKPFALLRDICNPLLSIYSALSEEKGVTLLTILPEIDHWLLGDAYRLKQILTNLFSNALKFAEPVAGQAARIEFSLFILLNFPGNMVMNHCWKSKAN
jgi:signal transduction histidine kinase